MERGRDLKNLESYLQEAVKNIRDDRAITSALLADIMALLKKNEQNHKDVGPVAAKYVETLQRSNEQLVKISGLMLKQETKESGVSLSDMDKDNIYDMIKDS